MSACMRWAEWSAAARSARRGRATAGAWSFVLVLVLLSSSLASCAASQPRPPAEGDACDSGADCMGDGAGAAQCAFVRLCIAGRCERVDDAGTPDSRTVSCE